MRSLVLLAALTLSALAPLTAHAQHPAGRSTDEAKVKARALADRGYELYQAGRHEEALAVFREADAHYRAPTLLLMMARMYEHLGRLLEAQSTYEAIVTTELTQGAPVPFHEAKDVAKVELAALARRIPFLKVVITGAPAPEVTLTINGAPVPVTGELMPRDPGRTTVVVTVPGKPPVQRVVTLAEGRSETLSIDLSPPSAAPARAATPPPPPPPPRGSLLPAAIAFGAAGLGLGIGTVTGVIAKVQIDDIKSRCTPDGHCLVEDRPKADRARSLITVSTIGFVTGGVAAAAGVTLLLLRPFGGEATPAQDASLRLVVGPASARLQGRF